MVSAGPGPTDGGPAGISTVRAAASAAKCKKHTGRAFGGVKKELAPTSRLCQNQDMEPYGQYCPFARAIEIIAHRWTLLIIRELLAGIHRFNDLDRGLPGISRPLLAERLRHLERAGVVERRAARDGKAVGYYLTVAGQELGGVVDSLGRWGAKWALGDPRPGELDAGLLLWRMRRRINLDQLPAERIVVRFDFHGGRRPRPQWMVFEKQEVSVCMTDPGYDTNLYVRADLGAFHKVWFGRRTWAEALGDGEIEIDGPPALARAFPGWLQWSPFAYGVRDAPPPARLRTRGATAS